MKVTITIENKQDTEQEFLLQLSDVLEVLNDKELQYTYEVQD